MPSLTLRQGPILCNIEPCLSEGILVTLVTRHSLTLATFLY